jgi:uncharacterized repeat protein (TIGR01451 family)
MGANPMHKDLFVQTDYMVLLPDCSVNPCVPGHSHQPQPDAINTLIAAYANAPVTNPDGTTGITLHLDCGPSCIMNPPTNATWGSLSSANSLAHSDPITGDVNNLGGPGLVGYDWSSFDLIKATSLSATRAPVFHYAVLAHNLGGQGGASGLSRDSPASDFVVSLGMFTAGVGSTGEQTGTIMHELGHNLGLTHGGAMQPDITYKPNFTSVMNYLFQTRGLQINGMEGVYDYSRFNLPTLNEADLNEQVGLNGGPSFAGYGTAYFCPGVYNSTSADILVAKADGPIDWNCDGTIESNVATHIYGESTLVPYQSLNGFNDWANLVFTGGSIGQAGAPPPLPVQTPSQELSTAQDSVLVSVHGVSLVGPGSTSVAPGTSLNLVFTVTNKGTASDTFTISASSTQKWANIGTVPKNVVLAAKATRKISIHVTVPTTAVGLVDQVVLKATSQANPLIMDSATASVTAASADVAIAVTTSSPSVLVGQELTYTLTVTNNGPEAAPNTTVTDTLPASVRLLSSTASSGTCIGTGTLVCTLGSLGNGATATVTITVIPQSPGTTINQAKVGVRSPTLSFRTTLRAQPPRCKVLAYRLRLSASQKLATLLRSISI